jgi:hypothetical protein
LTRPHRLEVRLTTREQADLARLAGGRPLGPALVSAALGVPLGPAPIRAVTAREALAALEAWATGLDRRSTSKGPALVAVAALGRLVRDA